MKKAFKSIDRVIRNGYALLGVRLLLGSIFILAAAGKIPEQARFVDVVTQYGLLPWSLARAYGMILPWLELTIGIFLVLGFLSRLAAGTSILMIISFIVANGTAVYSHNDTECGCFGNIYYGTGYLTFIKTSDALVIDIVMVIMAFIILLGGGGRWSLGSLIWSKLRRKPALQREGVCA
jgi:uncharacterized membrane protein YphA (DoxX/SURF4 family)